MVQMDRPRLVGNASGNPAPAVLPHLPYGHYYQDADQTVATGGEHKLEIDIREGWSDQAMYDALDTTNKRIILPKPGLWWCHCVVRYDIDLGNTTRHRVALYRNGSAFARGVLETCGRDEPETHSGSGGCQVRALLPFNGTTDYLEAFVTHNDGDDATILNGPVDTYIQVIYMGSRK